MYVCMYVFVCMCLCVFVCVCAVDDAYVEEESHREACLLKDVGTIWRGMDSHNIPLLWEYGQV